RGKDRRRQRGPARRGHRVHHPCRFARHRTGGGAGVSWLRGLFPVRREERGIVSLLYVVLAITVIANWVGKVGSNAIFIKNVGVTLLPIAYVLAPVVLLVASSLIFSLVGRMRRRDLFIWYVGVVTVLSIAAQVLLPVTSGD